MFCDIFNYKKIRIAGLIFIYKNEKFNNAATFKIKFYVFYAKYIFRKPTSLFSKNYNSENLNKNLRLQSQKQHVAPNGIHSDI